MNKVKYRLIGIASAAAATAALVLAPSAFAGQPVNQTLNPPPPPWTTCMAVGNGTICQGTAVDSYSNEDTGISCGSGAGAFDILDSATDTTRLTARYDASGNLVEIVKDEMYSSAQYSNPLSGAALPYTERTTTTNTFPGNSVLSVSRGVMNITAPGFGTVLLNTGRLIDYFNGEDNILFEAGPHELFPGYYLYGDSSFVAQLCAALGA